jgi:hypothetical protein
MKGLWNTLGNVLQPSRIISENGSPSIAVGPSTVEDYSHFETEQRANSTIKNISNTLVPGGHFIKGV